MTRKIEITINITKYNSRFFFFFWKLGITTHLRSWRDLFRYHLAPKFKRAFSLLSHDMYLFLQDNEVGHGSGFYNNQQFFQGKPGHSSFVPLCGLLKAEDLENGPSGSGSSENSFKRRNKKMVDELDLKRRSNSQQQLDFKMKQNYICGISMEHT